MTCIPDFVGSNPNHIILYSTVAPLSMSLLHYIHKINHFLCLSPKFHGFTPCYSKVLDGEIPIFIYFHRISMVFPITLVNSLWTQVEILQHTLATLRSSLQGDELENKTVVDEDWMGPGGPGALGFAKLVQITSIITTIL